MQCDDRYVERIAEKYNRKHVTAFVRKNAEQRFLGPFHLSFRSMPPSGFGSCRARLSPSEEFQLFAALHFMKYKIKKACRAKQRYINIYIALRNRVISANWIVVPSCIEIHSKKFHTKDHSSLMEVGNLNLLNSVDCFDPWRGFKFSTYVFSSILKGFVSKKRRSLPVTPIDENFMNTLANKQENNEDALWLERLQKLLEMSNWTKLEKSILKYRFGCFGYDGEKLRLEDVGNMWNLTKERIRQIQVKTLEKLKQSLYEDKILH